jgi:pSer/pThr/pTyr-binding forkhead associated (FHA) protein
MRIGSTPSCDIVVKGSDVSGIHVIIGNFPDGLLIRDEGSASGTFVNNEKIEHVTALMSGDHIRVGKTEFLVEYESEAAQINPPKGSSAVKTDIQHTIPVS